MATSERGEVKVLKHTVNAASALAFQETLVHTTGDGEFRYRGREITREDILYICGLIERHPNDSRRKLSTRLCEAWQWRQTNGNLRDMVCRGMLLMLERAGQISLPPVSFVRHNPQPSEPARSGPHRHHAD